MKRFAFILFLAVCVDASAGWLEKNKDKKFSGSDEDVNKLLVMQSNKMNINLPRATSSLTRLDTTAVNGKTIIYAISFTKVSASDVDPDKIYKMMKPKSQNNFCIDPAYKMFREYDVTMEAVYYGMNGNFITRITNTRNQCN